MKAIRALDRGLEVLLHLGTAGSSSLHTLHRATGIPKATLLRILKTLEYEVALSQKELASRTMLPERTIRLSLSHLISQGYVKKKTSLRDARQRIYELKI